MKRILAILLLVMFVFANVTFASAQEVFDQMRDMMSGMNIFELQALRATMDAVIQDRLGDPFILTSGTYTAGVDFPAGAWTISTDTYSTEVMLFKSESDFLSQGINWLMDVLIGTLCDSDRIGKLDIRTGAYLKIDGKVTMTPYTGLIMSQPTATPEPARPQLPSRNK